MASSSQKGRVLATSIDAESGKAKIVLGIDDSGDEGAGGSGKKRRRTRPAPAAQSVAEDECAVIGAIIPKVPKPMDECAVIGAVIPKVPKPMVRPPMRPAMRPAMRPPMRLGMRPPMRPGMRPPMRLPMRMPLRPGMRPLAKPKPRAIMPKVNPFAKPVKISLEDDEAAKAARIAARAARAEKAREEKEERRQKEKKKKKKRKRGESSSSSTDSQQERHLQALAQLGKRPMGAPMGIENNGLVTGGFGMGPPPISSVMEAASSKIGVCTKFLMGDCNSGDMCNQKHPSDPADIARWIGYFNRQPCKHGNLCTIEKCLYDHPNRAGYNPAPMCGPGGFLPLEPGKVRSVDPRLLVGTSL